MKSKMILEQGLVQSPAVQIHCPWESSFTCVFVCVCVCVCVRDTALSRTCCLLVGAQSSEATAWAQIQPLAHHQFDLGQFVLLMQNGANNRTYSGFAVRAEARKLLATVSGT